MIPELQSLLAIVKESPRDALPRIMGDLEEIRATCFAMLTEAAAPAAPDELLDIDAAAQRLGMSKDYLYRHHTRLPFTRRQGRKLLFSSSGINRYINQRPR